MYVGRESGFRLGMKAWLSDGSMDGATVGSIDRCLESEQLCVPRFNALTLELRNSNSSIPHFNTWFHTWMLIRIGAKQRPEQSKLESNGGE